LKEKDVSLRAVLRERPRFFVAIFLAFWISFLIHFNPAATGSDRFVVLALAMAKQHTLRIDDYLGFTTELARARGHYYLNTNPGLSFLALPAVSLTRMLPGVGDPAGPGSLAFFAAHLAGLATTTAVAGALTCVVLAALLLQRTGSTRWAILGAALYGFGSISFFFSTRLQQNVVIAFFATLVWALLRESPAPGRRRLAALGFLLGLGLFVDLSIVPLGVAVLVALLRERRLFQSLLPIALGAAVPVACLVIYQAMAFGHPFAPAQAYIPREGTVLNQGILGLTLPSPSRLLPELLSLDCGLLVFMPWTALALLPARSGMDDDPMPPRETWLIGSMVILYLLWVSILPSFRFCLFGPRYLMPFLPALAGSAVLRLRSWPRLGGAVLAAGFLINLAGAQVGIPTDNVIRTVAVYLLRGPWLPVVTWIQNNWKEGPQIVTPYGFLLLWIVSLAALFLWSRAERREMP
jgi:hypothetical protein